VYPFLLESIIKFAYAFVLDVSFILTAFLLNSKIFLEEVDTTEEQALLAWGNEDSIASNSWLLTWDESLF
jgi:hypothetical protein